MRRRLVTGACGHHGRAQGRLVPDAVLLTRESCDVTDETAVAEALTRARSDVVVHAAAWTNVDAAEADPAAARAVNETATKHVARACAESGALLVYPSTDFVFDGRTSRPYREDDVTAPLNVYGLTKVAGEDAARSAPKHLVVRTSWVFGEGRNFVRSILDQALAGTEISVVADQIGLPTAASDLAEGIVGLIDANARGTFHLAGDGAPCSRADLAREAVAMATSHGMLDGPPRIRDIPTDALPDAAPRPRYGVLDCSKASRAGVTLRPWRVALDEYVGVLARTGKKSA